MAIYHGTIRKTSPSTNPIILEEKTLRVLFETVKSVALLWLVLGSNGTRGRFSPHIFPMALIMTGQPTPPNIPPSEIRV